MLISSRFSMLSSGNLFLFLWRMTKKAMPAKRIAIQTTTIAAIPAVPNWKAEDAEDPPVIPSPTPLMTVCTDPLEFVVVCTAGGLEDVVGGEEAVELELEEGAAEEADEERVTTLEDEGGEEEVVGATAEVVAAPALLLGP